VELRMVFPLNVLTSTTGAAQGGNPGGASFAGSSDDAYTTILAQENAIDQAEAARQHRIDRLRHMLPLLIPIFLVLLFVPGVVLFIWIARNYGRDKLVGE